METIHSIQNSIKSLANDPNIFILETTPSGYPLVEWQYAVIQPIIYLLITFLLSQYMKNRDRIDIRPIAKVHNVLMSLFSLICAIGIFIEARNNGRFDSHEKFHCRPERSDLYWMYNYLFTISKIVEMLDTCFLILSKKPVIWLHKIHHATTFPLACTLFHGAVEFDFVPVFLNLVVHFFMYAYYAYPKNFRSFRIVMTISQILQFVAVLYYCTTHLKYYFETGDNLCGEPLFGLFFTTFLYIVYLVFFLNFFIQQYTRSANSERDRKQKTPSNFDNKKDV